MATYTTQAITRAGTTPTSRTAVLSGDKLAPDTNAFIVAINGSGSPTTLTFTNPGNNEDGEPNPDPARTIAAGTTQMYSVNPKWADPSDGLISIAWSAVTTVTFQYMRI